MPSRRELANAIRALSMDAVQKANSGHPGMPMGMADIAEVLWNDFLKHNPNNPHWHNRDRFILSNGHGCMLQYALLHLTGYNLTLEDIENFRQLHSKTPGHPEYGITPGVETTTGPLGQGFANAVGMALAEHLLAAHFNRPGHSIIDHYTYCFMGDGCLMEGISHEAGSLAGTLGLGKLIAFWDDNGVSIDGKVETWFKDNTPMRFKAYGWHVISDVDGHNAEEIRRAIIEARGILDKPTLICCKTVIGFGAPTLAGTEKTHGQALGEAEVAGARKQLSWEYPAFVIPEEIYHAWDARAKGVKAEAEWSQAFQAYAENFPDLANEIERRWKGILPTGWSESFSRYITETQLKAENIATRKASHNALNILIPMMPELFGGSADLSESNLTHTKYSKNISHLEFQGNYLFYGVREFAMSAMMNGIALYKGLIPYGGTFLTFLDYARNAVRLSALMKQRVVFIYTHDSVGLGEDGPTHQPIEHLGLLRTTPNMSMWRPCDATETAVAWAMALERTTGPTSLCLTRQAVKHQERTTKQMQAIAHGAYVLLDSESPLEAIIIATGSEVALAMEAAKQLKAQGRAIRVVSMPSVDRFAAQEKSYQESVLPPHIRARVAVEAGASAFWYQWVGLDGKVVGIDRYGESAPGAKIFEDLGMTVDAVIKAVSAVLAHVLAEKEHVS